MSVPCPAQWAEHVGVVLEVGDHLVAGEGVHEVHVVGREPLGDPHRPFELHRHPVSQKSGSTSLHESVKRLISGLAASAGGAADQMSRTKLTPSTQPTRRMVPPCSCADHAQVRCTSGVVPPHSGGKTQKARIERKDSTTVGRLLALRPPCHGPPQIGDAPPRLRPPGEMSSPPDTMSSRPRGAAGRAQGHAGKDVSDRAHHAPRGERRRPGPRAGRGARGPAGGPVRRRGGGGPGQGCRAVVGSAPLPRAGYALRRRCLRQRGVPLAEHAGRRGTGRLVPRARRRGRAVGSRPLGLAAARRHRHCGRRRSPGPGPLPGTSAPTGTTPAGGWRWRDGWPGCSTTTASRGRRCCAPGRPAATSAATATRSTTTCAGSRSCGAGSATPSTPPARPSCSTTPASSCGTSPTLSTLPGPPLGLRRQPALPRPAAGAGRARRAPRRAPLAAPLVPRALGHRRRRQGTGRAPPRRHRPHPAHATRCSPACPATSSSCSSSSPAAHPTRRPSCTTRPRRPTPCSAGSRPTSPPTASRPTRHPSQHGDRSVQVHACHGRTRQVEVLREVVVGLLADDPTLEPRDVLVMCPDVETFAPIIAATFAIGAEDGAAHPAAKLRVRLADRALRQTNALLAVLSQLLELGTARLTASQVLDLAGSPAVRQRFGFDDDQLERLRDWTVGAGVRWGLDAEHRARWQLGDVEQGSWRTGLDRLLLGAAMEGALDSWGGTVPLDDVDSSDIDLAGRLAELLDRLAAAQAADGGPAHRAGLDGRPRGRRDRSGRRDVRHVLAAPPAAHRARRHRRRRRRQHRAPRPRRRPRAARGQPRRTPDARELPHRHPHRLHAGADALGAAPRRLPARPRRRRLPAAEHPRRRRRPRPRPVGRRARPAQRGPPALPRRHHGRRGPPRHHLHRP